MPTIAVVIATFDRAEYIVAAVRSALAQELPPGWDRRVVVSDDGSQDDTVDRLRAAFSLSPAERMPDHFHAGDLWLRTGPNRERGAARNRGAALAVATSEAEWLAFLDSDDVLAPGALAAFVQRLDRDGGPSSPVMIFADRRDMSVDGALGPPTLGPDQPEGDILDDVVVRGLLSIGSTLVLAEAFSRLGGFSEDRAMSGSEDWHLWVRLAASGKALYSPHVSLHYRRHEGATPPGRFAESVVLSRRAAEEVLHQARGSAAPALQRAMWRRAYLTLAGTHNWFRQSSRAYGYAMKAVAYGPGLVIDPGFWRLLVSIAWRGLSPGRSGR